MKQPTWTPAPFAVGSAQLFSAKDLAAYENEVLGNASASEHTASKFFQKCPKFLHLGTGAEVRREVVLLGTEQRVDFFRRAFGEVFWDIIELKHPNKQVISGANSLHPRLSAEFGTAIDQAMDYRDIIENDGQVKADLKAKGIVVCRPQILVIVGRDDNSVDRERMRVLYDRVRDRGAVNACTYTHLYDFAKEHYQKTGMITVPTLHFGNEESQIADAILEDLVYKISHFPKMLHSLTEGQFVRLLAHVLDGLGYKTITARGGDDIGTEIIATREGLATTRLIVNCKHFAVENSVGLTSVQQFHSRILAQNPSKGIIVTTGSFTESAMAFIKENGWMLEAFDSQKVVDLIRAYLVQVRGDSIA